MSRGKNNKSILNQKRAANNRLPKFVKPISPTYHKLELETNSPNLALNVIITEDFVDLEILLRGNIDETIKGLDRERFLNSLKTRTGLTYSKHGDKVVMQDTTDGVFFGVYQFVDQNYELRDDLSFGLAYDEANLLETRLKYD